MDTEDVQGLLDAIIVRQPGATEWFKFQEELPKKTTYLRAASGRIRHLHTLPTGIEGLSARTREGAITALGRECRNFPELNGETKQGEFRGSPERMILSQAA